MAKKDDDDKGKKDKPDKKLFPDEEIPEVPPPGKTLICRPYITLKNGKRLYAHHYGKQAFCFYV